MIGKLDRSRRPGAANYMVVLLLTGILVALVVLIAVLVTQRGSEGTTPTASPSGAASPAVVGENQIVLGKDLPSPPKSPKPVDDPDRIKETLREGKTYEAILKAGVVAQVEDKAWGIKKVVNLAYAAEMQIDRTIEKNDGKRVVELRHFVTSRNVKLLCDVGAVTIDLGPPGVLLLSALEYLQPGTIGAVALAKPIAERILGSGAQEAAKSEATKAVAQVNTLSGKRVRITYVDGVGVEAIETVGCTLTQEERDFIFGTAVLSDCAIWDLKKAVGERWQVDGSQLSGLIDPSLRASTSGELEFVRDVDGQESGKPYAALRVEGGSLSLNSSDASTRRIGSFTPAGTIRFSLTDKFVERAKLVGRFIIESVSTDHILFETSFRSRPTLTVEYACKIR